MGVITAIQFIQIKVDDYKGKIERIEWNLRTNEGLLSVEDKARATGQLQAYKDVVWDLEQVLR